MENNYLLAKKIVEEKFDITNNFFYMYICALFGLFMKYPDNKELIIEAFRNTNIIIEDKLATDIDKEYGLSMFREDELEIQDPSVCKNYGVSDLGFHFFIQDGKVQMKIENPIIICSSLNISPANLINVFVHEMNHIIKSRCNSYGSKKEENGISSCYQRSGITYNVFTYDKNTDTLTEEEIHSILDEVINVFQTNEILNYILSLDGIVPDEEFQKYFDTLDKDELIKLNGYEKAANLCRRIWDNETLRRILEEHLIDGNLVELAIDFDNAVGMECFDTLSDWLDDLDYLFCLNNRRKDLERCEKALDKLIKNITSHKIKK